MCVCVCTCVRVCVYVCVCVCVSARMCGCVSTLRLLITAHVKGSCVNLIKQMLQLYMALAVDRDEPHIIRKLGMVIMYTNNYEKSGQFPYYVGTIVHVTKESKHSLLMLLI